MSGIHAVCVVALLVVALRYDRCFGYPSIRQRPNIEQLCKSCGDDCDRCEFGVVMTAACKVPQCAKGPDQTCGGPREMYGVCGEGMYCNCNKCTGCSSEEFECSKKDPCLPDTTVSRFDRFGRLPTAM